MKKIITSTVVVLSMGVLGFSQTAFSPKIPINSSTGVDPYVMASGHLNNDSYPDIIIGTLTGDTVEIYLNNGDGTFATPTVKALNGVNGLNIADIDGDMDNDILASSFDDDKLVWYANNGSGSFGTENLISSGLDGAGGIAVGNIDNDINNYVDVAVVVYSFLANDDRVVWFQNSGTDPYFGSENEIASPFDAGPGTVSLADYDGDGDLDALIGYSDAGNLEIYDNRVIPDGSVSFDKYPTVSSGNTYLFDAKFADVDNNGTLDILKVDSGFLSSVQGEVAWYDKVITMIDTTYNETIISTSLFNPGTANLADMDNDSDNFKDLVISNARNSDNDIIWFRSIGPSPTTFDTEDPIDNTQETVYGITINDFDDDGDMDIASCEYNQDNLNWFENYKINPPLGLEDQSLSDITVYPNPASHQIYLNGSNKGTFDITIFNIIGHKIMETTLREEAPLDIRDLTSGLYFIKINDLNAAFKFVKE